MHHHRAVVAEQPTAFRSAFAAGEVGVGDMAQGVFEGTELSPRGRGCDDEEVGEIGMRLDIEQDDRLGLAVVELFDDRAGEPFGVLLGGTSGSPRGGVEFRRWSSHVVNGSAPRSGHA